MSDDNLKKWYERIEPKPLPFSKQLDGISEKTLTIHHDKLYIGYINKVKEVWQELVNLRPKIIEGIESGNQVYSKLRALKDAETFALNGVYLHEWYFEVLGGTGDWSEAPELSAAIIDKWGSMENAIKYMTQCAMAARGWSVLCFDARQNKIMHYNSDLHNQGGVWGAFPIITIDVYEHAYFMDFGSDRKAYLVAFWKNFNWATAEVLYLKAREITL